MTDRAALADWIERYQRAWDSDDPGEIGELHGDDAPYRRRSAG